nr:MAG TPA: hypothetical protein [Caudoviricetes sp.]
MPIISFMFSVLRSVVKVVKNISKYYSYYIILLYCIIITS